jgi:hypothetical protein
MMKVVVVVDVCVEFALGIGLDECIVALGDDDVVGGNEFINQCKSLI